MLPKRHAPAHPPIVQSWDRPVIVFLTICTEKRKPILANRGAMELLLEAWRKADQWRVGRFVIMTDHIHLFCTPARLDSCDLQTWVQFWKSIASKRWPRREELPLWQKDFWDRQLRTGDSYGDKWEYVRHNPVRRGLAARAEDWPYQGELNHLPW
jgi:putative transposase